MRSANAAHSAAPTESGLEYSEYDGQFGGGDGVQA